MNRKLIGLFFLLFSLSLGHLSAQKVHVLELFDEIHPASSRYMSKGLQEAHAAEAELVIVHMNTYGGMVEYADSIRSNILDAEMPVVVYVDKNAASAGALISISCDSIYMAPGASIGAVTVVSGQTGEAMPDKYQSYMRATMRATAEQQGRDPKIAEKMVDQNLEIEGLSPMGTVITFTPTEAMKHGYAEAVFENMDEVLAHHGYTQADVTVYEADAVESIIAFLINPAVAGILVMLIFGGLFLEMKTPGVGIPAVVALIAASLFFAPHYIEGLADNWEVLVFAAGVILIAVEIFVVPGFGVTGISGITLVVSGLAISLLRNDFLDFTLVPGNKILQSFAVVLLAMLTSIILAVWIAKRFITSERAYPFVDGETQDKDKGYTAFDKTLLDMVGKETEASTDLKPSGFIEVEGRRVDAQTEGGFVEKGTRVTVLKVVSTTLIVRKA